MLGERGERPKARWGPIEGLCTGDLNLYLPQQRPKGLRILWERNPSLIGGPKELLQLNALAVDQLSDGKELGLTQRLSKRSAEKFPLRIGVTPETKNRWIKDAPLTKMIPHGREHFKKRRDAIASHRGETIFPHARVQIVPQFSDSENSTRLEYAPKTDSTSGSRASRSRSLLEALEPDVNRTVAAERAFVESAPECGEIHPPKV